MAKIVDEYKSKRSLNIHYVVPTLFFTVVFIATMYKKYKDEELKQLDSLRKDA